MTATKRETWHYMVEVDLNYRAICGIPRWIKSYNATESKRGVTCGNCRRILGLKRVRR